MWHKVDETRSKKYHLIASRNEDVLTSACGQNMFHNPKIAEEDPWKIIMRDRSQMCSLCRTAWHIACTSVEDARSSIKHEISERALRAALRYEQSNRTRATVMTMITARLKQLQKAREHVRERVPE